MAPARRGIKDSASVQVETSSNPSDSTAGSTELFVLVVSGELGLAPAVFGGILPALAGKVLGGTGIFAALTYAQVREEI